MASFLSNSLHLNHMADVRTLCCDSHAAQQGRERHSHFADGVTECRGEPSTTGPRHHLGVRVRLRVLFPLLSNRCGPGNGSGGRTGKGPHVGSKSGCCAAVSRAVGARCLTRMQGCGGAECTRPRSCGMKLPPRLWSTPRGGILGQLSLRCGPGVSAGLA